MIDGSGEVESVVEPEDRKSSAQDEAVGYPVGKTEVEPEEVAVETDDPPLAPPDVAPSPGGDIGVFSSVAIPAVNEEPESVVGSEDRKSSAQDEEAPVAPRAVNLADPQDVAEFIREYGIEAYDAVVAAQPVGIAWEQWRPTADSKAINRVSESNFEGGAWGEHLIWHESSSYPVHRFLKRQLPDGQWVARPASFIGDDKIVGTEEQISA